ncbi:MAG: signal peptidase II, partial [Bacteroidota bacterium]
HTTKQLVRRNMLLGESIPVIGDWFKLTFTENPGMAFGITLGHPMLVTVFAMIATVLIILYLWYLRGTSFGYRVGLSFILGGAIGNIIDRVFYGLYFGYGGLLEGQVVDFIHFDVWRGRLPEWIPFIGGGYTSLFPIWNVADMAIVLGVVAVLVMQNQLVQPTLADKAGPPTDVARQDMADLAGEAPSEEETPSEDPRLAGGGSE